jgi:hypothetical protein
MLLRINDIKVVNLATVRYITGLRAPDRMGVLIVWSESDPGLMLWDNDPRYQAVIDWVEANILEIP